MSFFIPFPFPNFGNGFFHSLPVPEFWEWNFQFPSRSQTLGMEFSIPVPVPEPSKVIPAHPCQCSGNVLECTDRKTGRQRPAPPTPPLGAAAGGSDATTSATCFATRPLSSQPPSSQLLCKFCSCQRCSCHHLLSNFAAVI